MISAQEAYDIAMPKFDKHIEFFDKKIREAASKGETSVIIREQPYAEWLHGPKLNGECVKILKILRDKGFHFGHFKNDGGQFPDFGMAVYWSKLDEQF